MVQGIPDSYFDKGTLTKVLVKFGGEVPESKRNAIIKAVGDALAAYARVELLADAEPSAPTG